jgi:hypothetical protein
MSKLGKAITAFKTGQEFAGPATIRVTDKWSDATTWTTTAPDRLLEYRIGVSIERTMRISQTEVDASNGRVLNDAVDAATRSIIEDVFGEFRTHLRAIEIALYQQDYEAARQALQACETQMFTTEER